VSAQHAQAGTGLFGLQLNAISAVSMIAAVGIGVEFTVHVRCVCVCTHAQLLVFSYCYLISLGTPNERMAITLSHMFIPVVHGGVSTLLGISMLLFSSFEFIISYFFAVLCALIVLGMINGVAVLPVLLSYIGPPVSCTFAASEHL
jgi:predicted RND superfamily exporter protein